MVLIVNGVVAGSTPAWVVGRAEAHQFSSFTRNPDAYSLARPFLSLCQSAHGGLFRRPPRSGSPVEVHDSAEMLDEHHRAEHPTRWPRP